MGNSLHPSDFTRIDEWANRIKHWYDNGLEELYFFMHMPDETLSPELSEYLTNKINSVCGFQLKNPLFLSAQDAPKKTPKSGKNQRGQIGTLF